MSDAAPSELDIWIALVDAVPIDPAASDAGGAFVHVLAPAENGPALRTAVDAALLPFGYRSADMDEVELLRNRLRTGEPVATELLELALDAALLGEGRVGVFYQYPDDHADPDAFERQGIESNRRSLQAALDERTLVRAEGHYDWHETIGYVVDVASHWALVQIVDACGLADGFRALRLEAIAEIAAVSPEASFLPALLRERPLALRRPDVDLTSTRALLASAERQPGLVYVATSDMRPGAFWIGRLAELDDAGVQLRNVAPTGEWYDGPQLDLDTITRVGFGGGYEEALGLAAGPDPEACQRLIQPPSLARETGASALARTTAAWCGRWAPSHDRAHAAREAA